MLLCSIPDHSGNVLTQKITGHEGSWESSCQAILILFIIYTRPGRLPSSVQIACLTTSFFMIAKTNIADYLAFNQPLSLQGKLNLTKSVLVSFLSKGAFKLLSLAIIITCLRWVAVFVLLIVPTGFHIENIAQELYLKRFRDFSGEKFGEYHHTSLQLQGSSAATKRRKMESCLLHLLRYRRDQFSGRDE